MKKNSNKKKENMIIKGIRLKECRIEKKLSQSDIAEILNCSSNHISMIERGERNLTYENAQILAKHLDVLADYLMGNAYYKTSLEESESSFEYIKREDNSFRRYLSANMDMYIWFKDVDNIEQMNYLNTQNIIFSGYGDGAECAIILEDGSCEMHDVECIEISDPLGKTTTHVISKDTYIELQEDIQNYIHYKIENLTLVNERNRNLLKNAEEMNNFYKKYKTTDTKELVDENLLLSVIQNIKH